MLWWVYPICMLLGHLRQNMSTSPIIFSLGESKFLYKMFMYMNVINNKYNLQECELITRPKTRCIPTNRLTWFSWSSFPALPANY